MKSAGEMLREYREARGMTQTSLARKVNRPSKRISAMEVGDIPVRVDELVDICVMGFEVTPTAFFSRFFPQEGG